MYKMWDKKNKAIANEGGALVLLWYRYEPSFCFTFIFAAEAEKKLQSQVESPYDHENPNSYPANPGFYASEDNCLTREEMGRRCVREREEVST